MREYRNQTDIDDLKRTIDRIDPGIRIQGFLLRNGGEEVSEAYVELPIKGNKGKIDKLVKAGFKKYYKYLCNDDLSNSRHNGVTSYYKQALKYKMPKKKSRAIYVGFNSHDCETRYRCSACNKPFGSWLIVGQKPNGNGTDKYCPFCEEELEGLE